MPRAPATLDPFNAVAEPRRRAMLAALSRGGGELPGNGLVETLGWPQPQVSKHLAVLLQVGLVSVRREGRERRYRVNGDGLRPIHDWVKTYERFWTHQLDRIKARAERTARETRPKTNGKTDHHQKG